MSSVTRQLQEKTFAPSLELSGDGEQLVVFGADRKIRVIRFRSGKLRRCYDESLAATQDLHKQAAEGSMFHLEAIDFGRRVAVERGLINDAEARDGRLGCCEWSTARPMPPHREKQGGVMVSRSTFG